jgi:hypothetical protein
MVGELSGSFVPRIPARPEGRHAGLLGVASLEAHAGERSESVLHLACVRQGMLESGVSAMLCFEAVAA